MTAGIDIFFERLFPRVRRGIETFSREEVRLPKGPRRDLLYDPDYAPFNKFIFDAFMDPYWRKMAVVGPTQNGKTLVCTNIPLLYILFEEEEDLIFGVPDMNLADGMWKEKLRPVIEDSRYADQIPTQGVGSRGGKFNMVQFRKGQSLRFMGAGGSAGQMSSHTAKYVIMSEVDKMDEIKEDSKEADPVSLIMMRSDAFEDSKVVMECTVTTEDGRIWQEAMIQGSGGRIYVACPYCGEWQQLTRDGLVFDPTSQVTAENTARYQCDHCPEQWDNNDRLVALSDPRLVHRGQTIDKEGNVLGDLPPTKTWGLHFNVLHSPMQSLAKTAGQQWEADTSELKEKKKAMVQSKWAEPWHDADADRDKLTASWLRKKSSTSPVVLGTVPHWATDLLLSVDMQKGYCWFMVEAYNMNNLRSTVVEYGTVDQRIPTDAGLINMLSEVEDIAQAGWVCEGTGERMTPSIKSVDLGGHWADAVYTFLQHNPTWKAVRGMGRNMMGRITGRVIFEVPNILTVRAQPNGQNLWLVYVDNTKALVHDRYLIESPDVDGYRYVPSDVDITWINHMIAEQREYDDLGDTFKWVKKKRRNDYLDLASYNAGLAYYLKKKESKKDEQKTQTERENAAVRKRENLEATRKQRQRGGWFSDAGQRLYR